MGGQQKDFISDIVFFQHQDGMRLKVRRHFLQCSSSFLNEDASEIVKRNNSQTNILFKLKPRAGNVNYESFNCHFKQNIFLNHCSVKYLRNTVYRPT
jgi:hypothetical protein